MSTQDPLNSLFTSGAPITNTHRAGCGPLFAIVGLGMAVVAVPSGDQFHDVIPGSLV